MTDHTVNQSATPCQAFPDPIPGIIPFGTVTLFAGAPGVGKTAMLAEWCRRWRDGLTICGHKTNCPTGFYYLAADRQWASHQQWFDAVGFSDIPHYSLADDAGQNLGKLHDPKYAAQLLLDCLGKLRPIPGSHLYIDPTVPLFISGDPNKARDVAASMLRFSRLCMDLAITLFLIAHFAKQKADARDQYARPQDRISGSGAFSGFSDTQIYLIDPIPPKQPYHLLGWVPRHEKPAEFAFERDEKTGLFVPFELYDELGKLSAVLQAIPYEPTETKIIIFTITKATNLSIPQAERYLAALTKEGRVVKLRRGLYKRAQPN